MKFVWPAKAYQLTKTTERYTGYSTYEVEPGHKFVGLKHGSQRPTHVELNHRDLKLILGQQDKDKIIKYFCTIATALKIDDYENI